MARGQSPITIVSFYGFGIILSAVYTYQIMTKFSRFRIMTKFSRFRIMTKFSRFRLLSVTPSNVGSFPLKLYFYKQLLILKGVTASLKNRGRMI